MAEEVRYDVDGYELVTDALRALIDQYPALDRGETFSFSMLDENGGKAIFPTTGAVIQREIESITGHVTQTCLYPFTVVYRLSGLSQKRKVSAKEWLDTFARWLEKQTVKVNGESVVLREYPELTGSREIRNMTRQTPAYLSSVNDNKSEDWVISMVVEYRNEFDK